MGKFSATANAMKAIGAVVANGAVLKKLWNNRYSS